MSKKFYVTLAKEINEYLGSGAHEEVNADEVAIGTVGQLIFTTVKGDPIVVYAPGTWVLFTDSNG